MDSDKKERVLKFIKKYHIIAFFVLLVFLLLAMLVSYKNYVSPATLRRYESIENKYDCTHTELITNKIEIKQTFVSNSDELSAISLQIYIPSDSEVEGELISELKQGKKTIQKWNYDYSEIIDGESILLLLDNVILDAKGIEFSIEITSDQPDEEKAVGLYASEVNTYTTGDMVIGGQKQEGDLSFSVYAHLAKEIKVIFLVICIIILLLLAACFYLAFKTKWRIEVIFLIVGLLIGSIYNFILPPFSAPDEVVHFNTAYYYSSKALLQESVDEDGNIVLREKDNLFTYKENTTSTISTYIKFADNLFKNNEEIYSDRSTGAPLNASFVQYLPQIAGLSLARLLDFDAIPMLMTARFSSLLFFLICCYYAIKKMPFGKMIIVAVALLPMTMELAASFSYDVMAISLGILLTAKMLNLIYQKSEVTIKDWVKIGVIMVFLAPCKLIYSALVFLCLLIPKEKFKSKKNFYIGAGAVILVAIVVGLTTQMASTLSDIVSKDSSGIVAWANELGYSLSYLLKNPTTLIKVFLNTLHEKSSYYFFETVIGKQLGWLNIDIPLLLVIGFFVILVLSAIMHEKEELRVRTSHKIWYFLIISSIVVAVMMSMLLSWTPISFDYITGVQGRYFLPALPLLVLLIRNKTLVLKKRIDYGLMISLVFIQSLTMISVFETVIML